MIVNVAGANWYTYSMSMQKHGTPLLNETGDVIGTLHKETNGWSAQTIFGYVMARCDSRHEAESVIRSQGLLILKGLWRYYDADDRDWFPCILKDVQENRVTVVRTNELGFEDPEHYKQVMLKNPSENTLQAA